MADMKSKEQSFYLNLSEVPPTEGFKDLLKNYSNVSEAETSHHIETVVSPLLCVLSKVLLKGHGQNSETRLGTTGHTHPLDFSLSPIWVLPEMTFQRTTQKLLKPFKQPTNLFFKN